MQNYGRLFSKIDNERGIMRRLFASRPPLLAEIASEAGISADFGMCQSARVMTNRGGH